MKKQMNKYFSIPFMMSISFLFLLISCAPQARYTTTKPAIYDTDKEYLNPQNMPVLWSGYTSADRNRLDSAISEHYSGIETSNPTGEQYYDLGMLLYRRCRLDEAAEMLNKALDHDPYNPEYYYLLGCVYHFSKQYDKAKHAITRTKQLGFMIDPETKMYFRQTCPKSVDLCRARLIFDIEEPYEKKGLYVNSVEQMLQLPDDEIDLATVALLMSREASQKLYSDSFDVKKYRSQIDAMVDDVLINIGTETRPSFVSSVISRYLFFERGFSVPSTDPADLNQPRYHLMNYVLDNRKGVCMSLSMLYLAIAERIQLPVYGVVAPGHFFVRYDDMVHTINIETTAQGRSFDNDHYRSVYPNKYTAETMYYKNLSKRETIGAYLNNFGTFYLSQELVDDAIKTLKLATTVTPQFTEPYINLGNAYNINDQLDLAIAAYQEGLKYNSIHVELLLGLARVYFQKGELDKALEELKIAKAINNTNPRVTHYLGIVYGALGQHGEAAQELAHALRLEPDSIELNFLLAREYFYTKNYAAAWRQVKKLRALGHHVDEKFLADLRKASPEPAD